MSKISQTYGVTNVEPTGHHGHFVIQLIFQEDQVLTLRKSLVLFIAILMGWTPLAASAQPAPDAAQQKAEHVMATVSTAAELAGIDDTGTPKSTETTEQGIVIGGEDSDVTLMVGLPSEISVQEPVLISDGAEVYLSDEEKGLVDVVVEGYTDGSVRLSTVIHGRDDPHEFSYPLTIPDGASIELDESSTSGIVWSNEGSVLLYIGEAWAIDAEGEHVSTYYAVRGNELVQVVGNTGDYAYPITAGPWLGQRLIDKIVVKNDNGGKRYMVHPSILGRTGFAPAGISRRAFWSDARSKGVPDTPSLRDQLYCHVDGRPATSVKSSWSLESWRKHISYTKMLAAKCNP